MAKQRPRQGRGTDGTDSADVTPGDLADTDAPRARRSPGANPQHVVQRRVTFVRACLIAGYTTPEIRRKVAKAYRNEAHKRKQHADVDAMTDADAMLAAIAELPTLVWGDPGDEMPSDRSVDRYIARAKLELEADGKAAARIGDRLFGIQLARLSQSYRVALHKRAPSAMVRVVEATNDLFAFDGAIRPALSALTAGAGDDARTGDKEPPGDASMTADAALAEMAALLDVARQRQRAQLAAGATIDTHPDREPDAGP